MAARPRSSSRYKRSSSTLAAVDDRRYNRKARCWKGRVMQKTPVSEDLPAHPWSAGFRSLSSEHDYDVDEIDGAPPPWLRGALFRNGSGRNDLNGNWFPHWFDGDGMISAIRFDRAGINYRNRYVRTKS